MIVHVLGKAKDLRTNTLIVYAQISIADYLSLVGENFSDFEIQRKRQKHKAYKRMKSDIIKGALLPTITLAIKPEFVDEIVEIMEADPDDFGVLGKALAKPGKINILDGLQRTFILKEIQEESFTFSDGHQLLIEFWLEKEIKHLIYRLIVLNAGQKPMSMRHQVELLFMTIKEKLESEIDGLEIFLEKEGRRRNHPKKYPLDRLVTAFESFLTKTPEINRENIIAQQMIESDIFDSTEEELGSRFEQFKEYLSIYSEIDNAAYKVYNDARANWIAHENVMNAMFAAFSDFGSSDERIKRIKKTLSSLLQTLESSHEGDDPFGLAVLSDIQNGFNPKKINIGFATRKLLTSGFKEYFREEGEKSLADCWKAEAM